jgi:hypothetical protein
MHVGFRGLKADCTDVKLWLNNLISEDFAKLILIIWIKAKICVTLLERRFETQRFLSLLAKSYFILMRV